MANHDVFISYSSKDKALADGVVAALEAAYIRCWIAPRDIPGGGNWAAEIIKGISGCKALVLIFTSHANESAQVKREIDQAVSKGLTIFPLRIEEVEPQDALSYHISSLHWLDALTPPLEQHFKNLARQVSAYLREERNVRGDAANGSSPAFPAKASVSNPVPRVVTSIVSSLLTLSVVAGVLGLLWSLGYLDLHRRASAASEAQFNGFTLTGADGNSRWRRADNGSWMQVLPNGTEEWRLEYLRRNSVDECTGIELRAKLNGYDIFIPDKTCNDLKVRIIMPPESKWLTLGSMVNPY